MKKPYVDYYTKHNVSPVINETDWERHFKLRQSLYMQIGLIPNYIKGKDVLEFGPGNGANSIYTLRQDPKKYLLVDANPLGLKNCKQNLKRFEKKKNWKLFECFCEDFESDYLFDLVIAEAFIPNQIDPIKCAKHCGSFVKPGGGYLITCHDHISTLPDTLRSFAASLVIDKTLPFVENVQRCVKLFEKDFSFLPGMTRSKEDWVIDNVLHEDFWREGPLFSISDAIENLGKDFSFIGSSPSFCTEWSWYKDITDPEIHFNDSALDQYWLNVHKMMNFNDFGPLGDKKDNLKLMNLCKKLRETISASKGIDAVARTLHEIIICPALDNSETKEGLRSFADFIRVGIDKKQPQLPEAFAKLWARSLHYVLFIKNHEPAPV